jgi:hypothetical protein
MHRSGTSAVTRVVNLLGVPVGRPERLMPVQPDNPAGFWEHLGLMDVNDAVLQRLGGSWDAPPAAERALADGEDLWGKAQAEFAATYDGPSWVFKDPRASLLLPFWRSVLGDERLVAIVVLRNPLDIAASLARRDRFAWSYSLALWEHYTRAVLAGTEGLPVLVVDYDALVDDHTTVTGALLGFLDRHGQRDDGPPPPESLAQIDAFLAAGLRHSRHDRAALDVDARVTTEQRALYDLVAGLVGEHEHFDGAPGAMGPPSPSTAPLLAARRGSASPELRALDAVCRRLGETEAALAECAAASTEARTTHAAVEASLGYTAIGRLERTALGAAARARRLQQRFTRR